MIRKLIIATVFILLPIIFYGQSRVYKLPQGLNPEAYSREYVVVKVKNYAPSTSKAGRSDAALSSYQTERFLPYIKENSKNTKLRVNEHPLANIIKVRLNEGEDPVEVINKLLQDENVIYAEPYFKHKPLFIPNDPEAQPGGNQWYLANIRAYDGWTIEKGDTSIVIGILDSGVLPEHVDFEDNLYINDDPINGIDDDNDGLVDNLKGWDIANNDNNPIADTDIHGHGVTGVSSASTNNGIGLAGVGFRSKFMPIKIFTSGGNFFSQGYEAIALAADLGCQVINLSWGSAGSFSQAGQDIINYAVEERDAVIVAAAGNTNAELDFYPASFKNVLSVTASNINDEKADFATFSHKIDLIAPGKNIFVSDGDGVYANRQGTSFSSPMVAGAAALVRSRFPNLTAKQVMERLRINSDDIYDLPGNQSYQGQLGKGRLNVFEALTNDVKPAIRIETVNYTNGFGQYAFYNDTLDIQLTVKNYLVASSNATMSLSSTSPYVTIVNGSHQIGRLNTLAETQNEQPFRVVLSQDLPPDTQLTFRVDFSDGIYEDFEYFTIQTSSDYLTVKNGNHSFTLGSEGELGYHSDIFRDGVGFLYKNQKVLDNIGFLVANDPDTVKDTAPNLLSLNLRDRNFEPIDLIRFYNNSEADIDLRTVFQDRTSVNNVLGVRVEQKLLAWDKPDSYDHMILEYRITNLSGQNITTLHSGLFADWNLNNKDLNEAGWDNANLLGYVKDASDTLYTGVALLSTEDPFYFAIDNKNANGNSADIPSSITDSKKFDLMDGGIDQTVAGVSGGGNDVSHATGYTFNNFNNNSSRQLAFALVTGSSLVDLVDAANAAAIDYQNYINNPPVLHITEVCLGENATIDPPQGTNYEFYSDVALTNLLTTGEEYITPAVGAPQTYYVVNKDQSYDGAVMRVIAQPKLVNADFDFSSNPLLLDESGDAQITFTDQSIDGVSWQWDFDNGFKSTVQHPIMNFQKTGFYDIELTVTSDLGCTETVIKTLEVANRSNKPDINNFSICKGDEISFDPVNATNLEVYTDTNLTNLIFSGTSFTSGPIYKDSVFYVISTDSLYQSNPKKVKVTTSKVKADFITAIDSTDLSEKKLLHLKNQSENETLFVWYINDQLIANSQDVVYNYSNQNELNIKLLAEDINGCKDSLSQTIIPKISPRPVVDTQTICLGDSTGIAPQNGSAFLFYADNQLNNLLAKGNKFSLGSLDRDTTIYITAIDSLLESEAIEARVIISDIEAAFDITPDSVNLAALGNVVIQEKSIGAENYSWYLADTLYSTLQQPEFEFNNTGEFMIKLTITDEIGCSNTFSRVLKITNITSASSLDERVAILIFPNPASEFFQIESKKPISIRLINNNGSIVFEKGNVINTVIDVSYLSSGIYTLLINENGKISYRKIIIQRP